MMHTYGVPGSSERFKPQSPVCCRGFYGAEGNTITVERRRSLMPDVTGRASPAANDIRHPAQVMERRDSPMLS